jgi:hypothetical protein
MKTIEFNFGEGTVQRYTMGRCWELALALADQLGWRAAWLRYHAFAVSPCGDWAVDVTGVRPLTELRERWDAPVKGLTPATLKVSESLESATEHLSTWGGWNEYDEDDPTLGASEVAQRVEALIRRETGNDWGLP